MEDLDDLDVSLDLDLDFPSDSSELFEIPEMSETPEVSQNKEPDLPCMYLMYSGIQLDMLLGIKEGFAKNDHQVINDKAVTLKYYEKMGPLDPLFRDFLLEFIENEADPVQLKELVTLSIETARSGNGVLSYSIPVVLLSDIFELITLDGCEVMFAYVEENVDVWKEDIFFAACKNNLLRLCNDLIRRSPRSTSNAFCGRIQLFLAKFFPFSERSGLNIISEFNLENTTEYGSDAHDTAKTKDNMDKDVDYNLYCKFWAMQDFFRSPGQVYDKVQWKIFVSNTNAILSTFKGIKLQPNQDQEPQSPLLTNQYFSKYLTSPKLFNLQLYDVIFRRNILVQFLIAFQYLTGTVRFKSENQELTNDQTSWVNKTVEKIHNLIKETPPDGENFSKCIRNMLKREDDWIKWKNEGCPDVKKALLSNLEETVEIKKEPTDFLGDILKESHSKGKFELSDSELTRLWNINPDNLEACKERDFLPTLESYFQPALQQMALECESDLFRDGNYGWRGLRLLARRSPNFFTANNNPISELYKYLEKMTRFIHIKLEKTELEDETEIKTEDVEMKTEDGVEIKEETDEIKTENDIEIAKSAIDVEMKIEDDEIKIEEGEIKIEEDEIKTEDDLDVGPSNVREVHCVGELIKIEDDEADDKILRFKTFFLPESHFEAICQKLLPSWKVVSKHLGFKEDQLKFFKSKEKEDINVIKSMLKLWFNGDDFSTLENFLYILKGLKIKEVITEVEIAIEEYTKTQTFFNAA